MSLDRPSYKPAQQGILDGFCGIYSGINFFCRRFKYDPEGDDAKLLFREILAELAKQKKLTVHRVCEGFREGQLQKAFNAVAKRRGWPVKVQRFEVFQKRIVAKTIFDAVSSLGEREAAMLSMNRGQHWVLAFNCDGSTMRVDDSSMETETQTWRRADTKSLGLTKNDGLVFLDAQTH